jgi:hypothetical protein
MQPRRVTVLCAHEASIPIKCYSPELMVQGIYSIADMESLLSEDMLSLDEACQGCRHFFRQN